MSPIKLAVYRGQVNRRGYYGIALYLAWTLCRDVHLGLWLRYGRIPLFLLGAALWPLPPTFIMIPFPSYIRSLILRRLSFSLKVVAFTESSWAAFFWFQSVFSRAARIIAFSKFPTLSLREALLPQIDRGFRERRGEILGKEIGVMLFPGDRTTARSITFSSSRTLPGQSYSIRIFRAAGSKRRVFSGFLPIFFNEMFRQAAGCLRSVRAAAVS